MTTAEEDEEIYRRASEAFLSENPMADVLTQESTDTVFGRPGSWSDVRKRITKLPQRPLLAAVSLLSVQLKQGRHPVDAVLQFRVAQKLADDSRRSRGLLRRLRDDPPRIVISEEQLAILARMAITHAVATEWPPTGNMMLLEVMLALNSLRASEIDSNAGDEITKLLFAEVRSSAVDVGSEPDVLKRWGAFVSWARTDDARESRAFLDLDDLLQRALGMSYLDFAASMMAFYSNFGARPVGPHGTITNYPFLDTTAFLESVDNPETLQRWLSLISLETQEARAKLTGVPLSTSVASLEQFMATPLLTDGGATYCPALRFLPNAAGDGLLFRLGQFLERTQDKLASDRLRSFFAHFLEAYVVGFLQRATSNRDRKIFRERKFRRIEERTSDIVIFDGDEAVFIDVNSKRFNLRRSVVGLEVDAIRQDLNKMIATKIKKVAKRAREFREGTLTYEGVQKENISRITGIVVTPQSLPRLIGITHELDRLLPRVPDGLDQWEFLELSEVEVLPRMFNGDLEIGALVGKKQRDEAGRRRSLTNYLWFNDRERLRDNRSDQERLNDPWFREVLARAQSWGLRADAQSTRRGGDSAS